MFLRGCRVYPTPIWNYKLTVCYLHKEMLMSALIVQRGLHTYYMVNALVSGRLIV